MKIGNSAIDFGSNQISTQTLNDILEGLIGHFLYYRNQLEKPLSQLKSENKPQTKTELDYAPRSTLYKDRDDLPGLFATPLQCVKPIEAESSDFAFSVLAESIKKVSLSESVHVRSSEIQDTPVIKQNKRRILGKMQQVQFHVSKTVFVPKLIT